jgi:hypothetical protein
MDLPTQVEGKVTIMFGAVEGLAAGPCGQAG